MASLAARKDHIRIDGPMRSPLEADMGVVAAHGESPYLSACLASLQTQDTPGEILVTTSTPSDFLARTARAAGVPLVINPERGGGIGADWTFAYAAAHTDFVTIAHQDDEYAYTTSWFARAWRVRCVGPVVEIYKLP